MKEECDIYLFLFFTYIFTSSPRNTDEKKFWTQEIPRRKYFGHTKYPRDKISDPRNTHEKKFRTHAKLTREKFGPTKYLREKTSDWWNTYEKEFWTDEIPTRKSFAPTKYHEKKFWTHKIAAKKKNFGPTDAWWCYGMRPTRSAMARGSWNLSHSIWTRQWNLWLRQKTLKNNVGEGVNTIIRPRNKCSKLL